MDILEKQGIKIPNAVLIKYVTHDDTDDEVVTSLKQYGKTSNIAVITEPGFFQDTIVVEFESGNALVELRKMLPYKYICQTKKYLGELKELAKLTGQDYAEVLKGLMSLLGQSSTEQCPAPEVKTCPDLNEEAVAPAPSTAMAQNSRDEVPQILQPSMPRAQQGLHFLQCLCLTLIHQEYNGMLLNTL
ncbi:hypothetical protein N1851_010418 [Merluccius polli]|uniref:Uncharacterized protein n=1 Tax=Merluccius polli TaxID=89951 RepID=A0AA47MYH6_MERPO|nr:hypothetical protein N1851_010418 [Merluccius polli]